MKSNELTYQRVLLASTVQAEHNTWV